MIEKYSKEKGSAHAIIVILLIIIVGVLGFIVWQNFIYKDSLETVNPETSTAEVKSPNKPKEEDLVSVHISDLRLRAMVPESLGDLSSTPIHLEGDQALNSVALSSKRAESSGCKKSSAPLGYLTYNSDRGGRFVAMAYGSELYYLPPENKCDVVSPETINDLQSALKSLVADGSSQE